MLNQRVKDWFTVQKKERQLTQMYFAELWDVKRQTVNQIANGSTSAGIKYVSNILAFDNKINARWLILGEGKMYESNKTKEYSTYDKLTKAAENNPNTDEEMNELNLTQRELIKVYREKDLLRDENELLKIKIAAFELGNDLSKDVG
ncbi:MAG: hypothetical protein QM503_10565 [Bacteroidota bacterium]